MGRLTDDLCALRDKFCCVKKPKRCTIEDAIEDIVENLPFGDETAVLFEQTVEFAEMEGMMGYMVVVPEILEVGKTYTITYNGKKYNCTGFALDVLEDGEVIVSALGNMASFGGEDTGEPFSILTANDQLNGCADMTILDLISNPSATIRIEKPVVHTIDPKFGTAFRVNVWYNGSDYVADKTYAEIKEAEIKRYPIVGTFTNKYDKVYTMIGCDAAAANLVRLASFDVESINLKVYSIYIMEDGYVGVNATSHAGVNVDE